MRNEKCYKTVVLPGISMGTNTIIRKKGMAYMSSRQHSPSCPAVLSWASYEAVEQNENFTSVLSCAYLCSNFVLLLMLLKPHSKDAYLVVYDNTKRNNLLVSVNVSLFARMINTTYLGEFCAIGVVARSRPCKAIHYCI